MAERRENAPIRELAQKWFDALKTYLAADTSRNDIIERLKVWTALEDIMRDFPRLLPPLLTMAWQLRHEPAFADLFKDTRGETAAETSTPLAGCNKSFDQVVLSHLFGAMRVYCARQEQEWLATEKARRRPTGLATIKILAPLIRLVRGNSDAKVLATYPQHGLYLALKPHLRHFHQFALVEALATLPTRTVTVLGTATRGLVFDAAIRNLALLETGKCKFVSALARTFAETIVGAADTARINGASPPNPNFSPPPERTNVDEIAGVALSHLALDGLHLAKGAISIRDEARDVVIKMSVPMGYEMWRVFANPTTATNIAICPTAFAQILGPDTAQVHRKTSEALNTLKVQPIIQSVAAALVQIAGRETLVHWAASAQCASVWSRLATELNQFAAAHGSGALNPETIAEYCRTLAPTFAALSAEATPQPVTAG